MFISFKCDYRTFFHENCCHMVFRAVPNDVWCLEKVSAVVPFSEYSVPILSLNQKVLSVQCCALNLNVLNHNSN